MISRLNKDSAKHCDCTYSVSKDSDRNLQSMSFKMHLVADRPFNFESIRSPSQEVI